MNRKQKLDDCYTAYIATKQGQRPKREAKDGSVPTHSVVPVPPLPEADVQDECVKWLKQHRIFHDTHDCGSGHGHAIYGIKGAGDVIGILPGGKHFELEIKRGVGGRFSLIQQQRLQTVRDAKGFYFIIHGKEELEHYFLKCCTKCNIIQLISNFSFHGTTKDRLHSWCKTCTQQQTRIWRQTIRGCLVNKFDSMQQRCNNPAFHGYKYWGGKGIKVLFEDVNEFIDYVQNELCIDPRGLDIHRIDNDKHYERDNIIFMSPTEHRHTH